MQKSLYALHPDLTEAWRHIWRWLPGDQPESQWRAERPTEYAAFQRIQEARSLAKLRQLHRSDTEKLGQVGEGNTEAVGSISDLSEHASTPQ